MEGAELFDRNCPACQNSNHFSVVRVKQKIPIEGWKSLSFSSRKPYEPFHWGYVECSSCQLWYTPYLPKKSLLESLYSNTSFITADSHSQAAEDYLKAALYYTKLIPTDKVIDFGAGDGSFLHALEKNGFQNIMGLEASDEAISAAKSDIRKKLTKCFLDPEDNSFVKWIELHRQSAHLVTCFQTIEHLRHPLEVLESARELLAPGGKILIVCHNVSGWVQRILRVKSPLLDIEHFQLFSTQTLSEILKRSGFSKIQLTPFSNSYSLDHWIRLAPIPNPIKSSLLKKAPNAFLRAIRLRVPRVNLLAVATRL